MTYTELMLKIPYDKYDGINVQEVERLCESADKELAANKKTIARLEEKLDIVNEWLNSDSIFTNYKELEKYRLLTKEG